MVFTMGGNVVGTPTELRCVGCFYLTHVTIKLNLKD
jgi:hypothetical protein